VLVPAASVILVRSGLEVLLMRRQTRGSWADAYVFPGGKVEAGDATTAAAAVRELFEESGVLLAEGVDRVPPGELAAWREQIIGGAPLSHLLVGAGLAQSSDLLVPWARWQTPPVEPRRFDATFYLTALPEGQTASAHAHEHVEHVWLTPRAALEAARGGQLRLPPPQLRTLWELDQAGNTVADALAAAHTRAPHVVPLMPRALVGEAGSAPSLSLLFPWDPAYAAGPLADVEGTPWPPGHPLAVGPSRVNRVGDHWQLVAG
jgi:8-oxo-dGTP pyrophosphatase MutT (NUDIX family)